MTTQSASTRERTDLRVAPGDQMALLLARTPGTNQERQAMSTALDRCLASGATPGEAPAKILALIDREIHRVECRISAQLNEIVHHPEFQQLESTWLGIQYMLTNTELGPDTQLWLWDVTQGELGEMLAESGGDVRTTTAYNWLSRATYETRGGEPWVAVIGGYDLGPEDVPLMEGMSKIMEQAHSVFIAGAAPSFLGVHSFLEMKPFSAPNDIVQRFDEPGYAAWREFRTHPNARNLALVLPPYLARLPYSRNGNPAPGVPFFEEDVLQPDEGDNRGGAATRTQHLWGNSAFLLGQRCLESQATHGWAANVTGEQGGGVVNRLPVCLGDDGQQRPPVQMLIDDSLSRPLGQLGFVTLSWQLNSSIGIFENAPSAHQPPITGNPRANADAMLAARLPNVLSTERFAQYLKCMLRKLIGSKWSQQDVQKHLETWISGYTLHDPSSATESVRAERPLKAARIKVLEVDGHPGQFIIEMALVPHHQVESVQVSLSISTE